MEETFASRLREAMTAARFKQVDLVRTAQIQGRKLGKSQLSQYLSGKTTLVPKRFRSSRKRSASRKTGFCAERRRRRQRILLQAYRHPSQRTEPKRPESRMPTAARKPYDQPLAYPPLRNPLLGGRRSRRRAASLQEVLQARQRALRRARTRRRRGEPHGGGRHACPEA